MPVPDEITKLLSLPEDGVGAPTIDAIESTLTNGYAEALALDAERWRIERRLGAVARDAGDSADVQELARLSERLETADGELARLRGLLRSLHARARTVRTGR
jgi:hypothetical protein